MFVCYGVGAIYLVYAAGCITISSLPILYKYAMGRLYIYYVWF